MKKYNGWKWWMRFKGPVETFDSFQDASSAKKRADLQCRGFKRVGSKSTDSPIVTVYIWSDGRDVIHEHYEGSYN